MLISKLAVIGECMAELSSIETNFPSLGWGGDVLNTAIYCKRLMGDSLDLNVVTAMGTDPLSRQIVQDWHTEGLNTQYVMFDESHHVGLYAIHNQPDGERAFTYWRNDSAARYMMHNAISDAIFEKLLGLDAVYFSGISLAILSSSDRQKLIAHLTKLKSNGIKLIFDGNYRQRLWESEADAKYCYQQAYQIADLLLLTVDDEIALWDDKDLETCTQRLAQFNKHELVLKSGSNGCYYVDKLLARANGHLIHYPTYAIHQAVDTTAAGDSFNAGFLAGWLQGQDTDVCASMANNLAGQVIQKKGAIVPIDTNLVKKTNNKGCIL